MKRDEQVEMMAYTITRGNSGTRKEFKGGQELVCPRPPKPKRILRVAEISGRWLCYLDVQVSLPKGFLKFIGTPFAIVALDALVPYASGSAMGIGLAENRAAILSNETFHFVYDLLKHPLTSSYLGGSARSIFHSLRPSKTVPTVSVTPLTLTPWPMSATCFLRGVSL
jgi:hypothetical protein